jgi:hypothetical protein
MTSSIGIAHSNLIDDATLSTTGDPWSNLTYLQNRALSLVARSASADAADTIIDIDHGSAETAQVLWMTAHNLSSSATFVIERGTTPGGTDVYAGNEMPAWPFTPLNGVYSGRHFGFGDVMASANSARYTRLRVLNSTNPAGYVQMGRPFIGPAFFPAISPTKLDADWMPSLSTIERTEFGADWVDPRSPKRRAGIVFGALTYEEGSELHEIQRLHDTTGEVVYIAHRTDRARMQQFGFLGLFRELTVMQYPFHRHNGIALGFEERGGAPL